MSTILVRKKERLSRRGVNFLKGLMRWVRCQFKGHAFLIDSFNSAGEVEYSQCLYCHKIEPKKGIKWTKAN